MPRISYLSFHDRLVLALTGEVAPDRPVGLLQIEAAHDFEPPDDLGWMGEPSRLWLLLTGDEVTARARRLVQSAGGRAAGLAISTQAGDDPEMLFAATRQAFRHSRADGGGLTVSTAANTPNHDDQARIDLGDLELHFQPQACVRSGRLVGAEALVRLRDCAGKVSSPGAAIAAAEAAGDLWQLTQWTLEQAGRLKATWQAHRLQPVRLAVNLSLSQFDQGHVVRRLVDHAAAAELKPSEVEFELTERSPPAHLASIAGRLSALRQVGFRIALDDLGTGFSSLSLLKTLPLDKVKVDRRFVRGLGADPPRTASLREVMALAGGLGIEVLAEGVEREEELAALRVIECDLYQGYYLSPPLTDTALTLLLAGQASLDGSNAAEHPSQGDGREHQR